MLRNISKLLFLLLAVSLTACQNHAPTTEPSGDNKKTAVPLPDVAALIKKLASQDGAKDATSEMRLQVEEANGQRAQLDFQLQRKYSADRVATFLKVNAPQEDSDKALLAIEKEGQATEAFSYLAGLRKLAKLGSSNRLSFRNTRVSVQELLAMELNQYSFNAGEHVTLDGMAMIKVEGKAKFDRNLAFARLNVYFQEDNQQPARFELFDERDQLQKTTRVDQIKTIQNRQTITKVSIEEPQAKRKATLETRAVKYDQNLADKIFTEENLKSLVTSASLKLAQ